MTASAITKPTSAAYCATSERAVCAVLLASHPTRMNPPRKTSHDMLSAAEKIASALDVFLDDETLEHMKSSGFRNPEAYVAYQKGQKLYNDAHNHWDITGPLEEANTWFDRVIELEPGASRAYLHRVDMYTHQLSDSYGVMTDEQREFAEERFRADLDAAVRTATDEASRAAARFDRAALTGNWREIPSLLADYGEIADCPTAAWINANTLEYGMASDVLTLSERLIACDPQNPFGWWYVMQASMWLGDPDRAAHWNTRAGALRDALAERAEILLIGEDIELITHLDPALGQVKTDPGQIIGNIKAECFR